MTVLNKNLSGRFINKEGEMLYVSGLNVIRDGSFAYTDENGVAHYLNKSEVMLNTGHNVSGVSIYDKDVVIYNGSPCLVFADTDRQFWIVYENDKISLKSIASDVEILGDISNVHENMFVKEAVDLYNNYIHANRLAASVHVFGGSKSGVEIGMYGVSLNGEKQSNIKTWNTGERGVGLVWAILAGIKVSTQMNPKVKEIDLYIQDEFTRSMINNLGILKAAKKNGWVWKSSQRPVNNATMWNALLKAVEDNKLILRALESEPKAVEFFREKVKRLEV